MQIKYSTHIGVWHRVDALQILLDKLKSCNPEKMAKGKK
jgi:hypothetical protein